MPKIIDAIPPAAFEIIRDRIAEILKDEINNQVVITGDSDMAAEVVIEQGIIDAQEMPIVNVSLSKGTFDNKDAPSADGTYIYNVDCYVSANKTDQYDGDYLSSIRLHKLLGWCRAILENPNYRTLGYVPGIITRVNFLNFDIAQKEKADALNTGMGRLYFQVLANEITELIVPRLMSGYETTVKMNLSNSGYNYLGGTE